MIDEFRIYMDKEEKTSNTIESYIQHVRGFLKWFNESKDLEFKKLHRENVKDYIAYLKTIKKLKPSSINSKIGALIKFNDFLIENKIQDGLVISKKDNIKTQQQYASLATIDQNDVEKLRQLILDNEKSSRNHAIITLLAYAGLRISEAINIKMSEFNLSSRELIVDGKGKKTRVVFINDKVHNALREWLRERKASDSENLFISNRDNPVNRTVVNKLFNKYSKMVGKEITPHDLRHFFCSYAISRGMSVHEVANQAGHSNIHTTLLYTNPNKNELKEKMNLL
ncbi:tyrosine-type recombinase/integrase [Aquibacillus sediminis]|uniref:tyrosine-type recombinase/integrase n=1 Tax=Aquibacillus sediminis TaxID=2574734 RepID=UPI0011086CD2|nr:tyrosine-type recombinase/integrase [Aquibacillus sediminis]